MKAGQLTGFACPDRTVIRSLDESSIRKGGHFPYQAYQSAQVKTTQRYLPNTNILVTEVSTSNGDTFRITDFLPPLRTIW